MQTSLLCKTSLLFKPHCFSILIAMQASLLCKPHCYANLIAMQTSLLCKTSLLFKPHCNAKPHCYSNLIAIDKRRYKKNADDVIGRFPFIYSLVSRTYILAVSKGNIY